MPPKSPTRLRLARREALHRVGVVGLGVGLLPVLQACGGDEDEAAEEAAQDAKRAPATEPRATTALTAPARTEGAPSPQTAGEHVVEMNDQLQFVPDSLTIKVGETVTWTTVGAIPHTATADSSKAADPAHVKLPEGAEPWDSGMVNQGESWSRTFDVPGEYAYFCIPHEMAGMVASLTVTA